MKILVFVDDERYQDDVFWFNYPHFDGLVTCRNYKDFCAFFDSIEQDSIDNYIFSFDHDLQDFHDDGEYTGYDCLKYIVSSMLDNNIEANKLNAFSHSKNIIGRENIDKYIQNFKGSYYGTT